jgi:hypothetical protein
MKKQIILILIITIGVASCNKNKTAEPITPQNTAASTNQTGLIDLFRSQYFNGSNMITAGENVTITFINYSNNSSSEVPAGNVSFNSTVLKFDGINYEDTTYAISYTPSTYTISASGSSQIDAFSTTFPQSFPAFSGDALLPTTVSKSVGFTVNLGSSIVNASDTSTIHILNSSVKKIAPGQTSVTFTPSDLSGIMVANGYYFEINLCNRQTLSVNGKNYYVKNNLLFTKYNVDVTP